MRECRIALGQSQAAFAAMIGASPESYRPWDAGRRAPPLKILARARALATHRDDHALLPLPVLALLIGVHVKTLRAAARDGRLPVTYDTRTTFRRLRARATPAAARAFRRSYYGRPVKSVDRRAPLTWASVPDDYDEQIRALRRACGLSQAQLATLVGAARKAVVYQWEARTRTPLPLFWQRLTALFTTAASPSATGLASAKGVVARIVPGPHEAHRQDPHRPMRYDTGRPRAVIRLRISPPMTTSLPCPAGLRARRPSPMMDL